MKKRIMLFLSLVVVCLALLRPICTNALVPLDPNAEASLTLHYQKDGETFSNLNIGIYRIAEAFPNGTFQLIEPFASYPIDIHYIKNQEQWNHIAQTLCSYIVADQVAPSLESTTDSNGTVCFSDLKTGLYFVRETVAQQNGSKYVFNQFLIYVPTPQSNGTYQYDVEANPKCTKFKPYSHYTITKLWQDGGNQNIRPKEVTVDIYIDGILYKTRVLNEENNWTYRWYASDEDYEKWTVVERDVPDIYKVMIQQSGSNFSIINTYQTTSDVPPTGDNSTPLLWILGMCFSGILLLILGIYMRRRK